MSPMDQYTIIEYSSRKLCLVLHHTTTHVLPKFIQCITIIIVDITRINTVKMLDNALCRIPSLPSECYEAVKKSKLQLRGCSLDKRERTISILARFIDITLDRYCIRNLLCVSCNVIDQDWQFRIRLSLNRAN